MYCFRYHYFVGLIVFSTLVCMQQCISAIYSFWPFLGLLDPFIYLLYGPSTLSFLPNLFLPLWHLLLFSAYSAKLWPTVDLLPMLLGPNGTSVIILFKPQLLSCSNISYYPVQTSVIILF